MSLALGSLQQFGFELARQLAPIAAGQFFHLIGQIDWQVRAVAGFLIPLSAVASRTRLTVRIVAGIRLTGVRLSIRWRLSVARRQLRRGLIGRLRQRTSHLAQSFGHLSQRRIHFWCRLLRSIRSPRLLRCRLTRLPRLLPLAFLTLILLT